MSIPFVNKNNQKYAFKTGRDNKENVLIKYTKHLFNQTDYFKADCIQSMDKFIKDRGVLSYDLVLRLAISVGTLYELTTKSGFGIPYLSYGDFAVVIKKNKPSRDELVAAVLKNDKMKCKYQVKDQINFVFKNTKKLYSVDENGYLKSDKMIKYKGSAGDGFETYYLKQSGRIHNSSGLYSLVRMVARLLFKSDIGVKISGEEFERVFEPIRDLPLYWAMRRCVVDDERDRVLVII